MATVEEKGEVEEGNGEAKKSVKNCRHAELTAYAVSTNAN
jgi:hypothetical protein